MCEVEPRALVHHGVRRTFLNYYSIGKKLQLVITHFQKPLKPFEIPVTQG